MFDRLKQLCGQPVDRFHAGRDPALRYHQIDWGSRNVPISRQDLTWLPADILDNPEEFPFFQIHVSKALGRIIGFWDVDGASFNIILLDPLHNCQPSRYNGYRVRDTVIGECHYTSLWLMLQNAQSQPCLHEECALGSAVRAIKPHIKDDHVVIIAKIKEPTADRLKLLIDSRQAEDVNEVLELCTELYDLAQASATKPDVSPVCIDAEVQGSSGLLEEPSS